MNRIKRALSEIEAARAEIEESEAEVATVAGEINGYEKFLFSTTDELDALHLLKNEFNFMGRCKVVKHLSKKSQNSLLKYPKENQLTLASDSDAGMLVEGE